MRGEYTGWRGDTLDSKELPPRARRIHFHHHFKNVTHGTTSACAENTVRSSSNPAPLRNYLRVRGEYLRVQKIAGQKRELPPRARRIHGRGHEPFPTQGTTSACAENTWIGRMRSPPRGNYLRVRGEYRVSRSDSRIAWELPPRARRIPRKTLTNQKPYRTTSACAENTLCDSLSPAGHRNYLRVRGEYIKLSAWRYRPWELPPRARRIPMKVTRFTSTTWNYLRVRGEYSTNSCCLSSARELPPRARRILVIKSRKPGGLGTTSACAENTWREERRRKIDRNYLRVRGEYREAMMQNLSQ